MSKGQYQLSLLKFGNEKHITDLYENGTIYINPIEYFRKIEDNNVRGDSYEGVIMTHNISRGKIKFSSYPHELDFINGHYRQSYDEVYGNIYCMYAISNRTITDVNDFQIDARNLAFGSHCLFIYDCQAFLNRIIEEIDQQGYKCHVGFVRYYDPKKHNGELSVFDKPIDYEYQKEYRFYLENDKVEPIVINLGSLKEYSKIFLAYEMLSLRIKKEPIIARLRRA